MGIGDPRDVRIDPPEDDLVHLEPGVERVADVRNPVGDRGAGEHVAHGRGGIKADGTEERSQSERPSAAALRDDPRPGIDHQPARTVLFQDVDDLLRDLGDRPVPGDSLPFSPAPFSLSLQRMKDAVLLVHRLRVDRPLLHPRGLASGMWGLI